MQASAQGALSPAAKLNATGYPVGPMDRRVTIVIPVADEEGNILPLAREITGAMQALPVRDSYEILFVDDLSRDKSRAEIIEAMAQFPNIRLICHAARYGKSEAVRTAARNARGAWIITMDGDGQNDPADLKAMMDAAWEKSPDDNRLVCGFRKARAAERSKRWASRLANAIRGALLNDKSPDAGCALKMYRRDAHLAMPYFDNMHRFDQTLYALNGIEVVFVPVNDRERKFGVSKYTNWQRALVGFFDLLGVLWLQNRKKTRAPECSEVTAAAGNRKTDIAAE
jgi:dolichol-phosphate mannosyltransferase